MSQFLISLAFLAVIAVSLWAMIDALAPSHEAERRREVRFRDAQRRRRKRDRDAQRRRHERRLAELARRYR